MNSMMVLRLLHCFYLLSRSIYTLYILFHLFPHPSSHSPAYRSWWGVVSMARVEELNVSHVALWKWRSEGGGANCSQCYLYQHREFAFCCLALLFLSFWMLHGTGPRECSCPQGIFFFLFSFFFSPDRRETFASPTTSPTTGTTGPFHSVVVRHSGSNLLHCCCGLQLELDKNKSLFLAQPESLEPGGVTL